METAIQFNQAIFSFMVQEIEYHVFFTPHSNGNMHIKVCDMDNDKILHSAEYSHLYEVVATESEALGLLHRWLPAEIIGE
jgi:hypothetical protein